ncbi:MAG TPA: DNA-directed RNA polymerase subunit omega [Phycisphaerae bacterium]|nr:DNA-directed RNA polymerase subunit omega [Phycisphaerae bacterium]
MIEYLKDDEIIKKAGGRFKLTALMQKRWIELMQDARPLVDPDNKQELEIIAQEIMEDKISAVTGEPEAPQTESASGGEQQ